MSLFRRRSAAAGNEPAEAGAEAPPSAPEQDLAAEYTTGPLERVEVPHPEGPWDVADRPDPEGYIDLGALWLLGRDGMELRLDVEEATGAITTATVQLAGSAVQFQVFAAPRSEGLWEEIRAEIAEGIVGQGGSVDEVPGSFGRELLAKIPARSPDGRVGHQWARFVGVDGPRWFLRAVLHGRAVHDADEAVALEAVIREAVVVRGAEAKAPRELLPLRLPQDLEPQQQPEPEAGGRPPLEPFQRGPEITEIH